MLGFMGIFNRIPTGQPPGGADNKFSSYDIDIMVLCGESLLYRVGACFCFGDVGLEA